MAGWHKGIFSEAKSRGWCGVLVWKCESLHPGLSGPWHCLGCGERRAGPAPGVQKVERGAHGLLDWDPLGVAALSGSHSCLTCQGWYRGVPGIRTSLGLSLAGAGGQGSPGTLPMLTSTLFCFSLMDDVARRGRIGACSRGWGRRGQPRGTPSLHLCHLGLPEDRPPLRAPWSSASGPPPRGTVCRLHSAVSSLSPASRGPSRLPSGQLRGSV